LLAKVTGLVDIYGGDLYSVHGITGGTVRLPEPTADRALTQADLWSLQIAAAGAVTRTPACHVRFA
jgi:hypothetical protein